MEKLTSKNLSDWQEKYQDALNHYQTKISNMEDNYEAFLGTRAIKTKVGSDSSKQTMNVRKVCFELVETQVDSNIPLPKVVSKDGYEEQAMTVEMFLKNEADRLPMEDINDLQERLTKVHGGAFFFLEWDNTKGTRTTSGEIHVRNVDAKQVIPQPGVYDIEEMDYIFIKFQQTRQFIYEKYGVKVDEESGDSAVNTDLMTHIYCFYKDENGDIGLFSYVGDTTIQDFKEYYKRRQYVCKKCQKLKKDDKCECGSKDFEDKVLEYEMLDMPEIEVNAIDGKPNMTEKAQKVPYYVPKCFPLVPRKNVSGLDEFLGLSDVEFIKDQQNDLNIFSAKIREKLLKGGSIVIKPSKMQFKANNDEMKIINVDSPADMAMFDVRNVQADVSRDLSMLEQNYVIARQTIGITDSFQGRPDQTATSGRAKEIAAQQSAGRMVSKRKMKDTAFAKLYEYMFKFLLAYADEPRSYAEMNEKGQLMYKKFDKRDFILKDSNNNFYYNDQFLFSVDVSSTLSNNREAMWQEVRMNLSSGAYGNPTEIGTLIMFWEQMNMLHYPGAKQALTYLQVRKQEEEAMMQQQMAMQQQQVDIAQQKQTADEGLQIAQMQQNQAEPGVTEGQPSE